MKAKISVKEISLDMKKITAYILMLCLVFTCAFALTACKGNDVNETPKPSEAPTDEPTNEPDDEPTEAPTDEPDTDPTAELLAQAAHTGYELGYDSPLEIDFDGDGITDTILVTSETEPESGDFTVYVTVTLGCDSENPYVYESAISYFAKVLLVDSNPEDGRLEVVIATTFDSDDSCIDVLRANGGKVESLNEWCCFQSYEDGVMSVLIRTDIMGTNSYCASAVIGDRGITVLPDEYELVGHLDCEVIDSIDVLVYDEESETFCITRTLEVGETVYAYATDAASYVLLVLGDGSLARLDFELDEEICIPVINGRYQHEYFTIPYAD